MKVADANAIIKTIVLQHAEEAAFLWLLRDRAVFEPHYSLEDLAKLDERVEAHLDGLRIAGDEGWEICKEQLKWEEAGEVFTAAVPAFESGQEKRIQEVLEKGSASPELARGVVSALGWIPYEQAKKHIEKLLASESADLRRIGLAASAIHRKDPGQPLLQALAGDNSSLKARALRAVGELGRADLLPTVQKNLSSSDEGCRFWAGWSAALLTGDAQAINVLKSFAVSTFAKKEEALKVTLRRMSLSAAHRWRTDLSKNPGQTRLAVMAAGVIGDPESVPWLMEQMKTPALARVAGEAFTMITGVDIAYEDLEGEWPEGFEAGPAESPEDENVELDPDENLPWPNPELIQKWWSGHQKEFQKSTRYLLGKPISPEGLQEVLKTGRQRQRATAAVELALLQPGRPLFETRAPGFRQKQILK